MARNAGWRTEYTQAGARSAAIAASANSCSAAPPPFASARIGGLVAFYSLIHVRRAALGGVLAEFHRVLRPGGRVLFFGGLPASVIFCDNRGMLIDRVTSLRTANIYQPHQYRHIVSGTRMGASHAIGHALGGSCGVPHGYTSCVILPHVLRYNASLPPKFMPAPGYSSYVAPEKYAQLGRVIFGGRSSEEARKRLFVAVEKLLDAGDMPRTLRAAGIENELFYADNTLMLFGDAKAMLTSIVQALKE